jgi:hypothetical protein
LNAFQTRVIKGDLCNLPTHAIATSEIATALFAVKFARERDAKRIEQKVMQISPDAKLIHYYGKHEKVRRKFYHSWKIDWNVTAPPGSTYSQKLYLANDQNVSFSPISGGFAQYFLRSMAKATHRFCHFFANDFNMAIPCLSFLEETLLFASNQNLMTVDNMFNRYRLHRPLFLAIEFRGHVLIAFIWENYFVICNKGEGFRKTIEIFRFSPRLLTKEILTKLTTKLRSKEEFEKLLFTEVAKSLCFQKMPFEELLETILALPPKDIGNCSWESSETAAYALLMIQTLKMHDMLHYKTYRKEGAQALLDNRARVFNNWLLFQQLEILEEYLAVCTSPWRRFVSNNDMFPELINKFQNLKEQVWIHTKLYLRMKTLEQKFPFLTGNSQIPLPSRSHSN